MKEFVDVKYHGVIDGDFSNVTSDITAPDISIIRIGGNSSEAYTSGPAVSNVPAAVPEIDYDVLERATDNWNEKFLLGKGGFGSVYQGTWTNTDVAIKRIEVKQVNLTKKENERLWIELRQSLNELRSLNQCRHDNIVQIFGYSSTAGKSHCLVYELMRGGTLADKLFKDPKPFTWKSRVRIMMEAARGLQFLHDFKNCGTIIHGDIKPANILLDEHMKAKIGDFGLARESQTKAGEVISRIFGTQPYLPDEFIKFRLLSTKVDSFSFGIVLFEVATKKRAWEKSRSPAHLKTLIKMYKNGQMMLKDVMDTSLGTSDLEPEIFEALLKIGVKCVKEEPAERWEMTEVFKALEKEYFGPKSESTVLEQ